ncbi:MAG: hypothetical protein ACM3X7_02135 [Solirubrobacterales bacterium]
MGNYNLALNNETEDKLYTIFSETMKKYELLEGTEDIIFLFSGGKDATIGLYFLNQYIKRNDLDLNLRAVMVTYPTHVYFHEDGRETECFTSTKNFWKAQGVNLEVFISDTEDLRDGEVNGCKICKSARKQIVDKYLNNATNKKKTAIVTGYTLYDILAYMDEISLVSNYNFKVSELKDKKAIKRVDNCLHKMKIKEDLPNGFRIIRPLAVFNEDDILEYVKENSIPYVNRPCKVSTAKHKRAYFKVLNIASPINNVSYEGVLNFLSKNEIEMPQNFDDIEYGNYFTDC